MKVFHCDHCEHLVFFENTTCLKCGRVLGFSPDVGDLLSLEKRADGLWDSLQDSGDSRSWRLCANYSQENVCNWVIPEDDPNPLCRSCRLTHVIPNLGILANRVAWAKIETAKRRLLFTLLEMGLPLVSKATDLEHGLVFEFLADEDRPGRPVLSGHADGVITINIAEADDSERERRRNLLHEPYRTLLGHFRHESGHYYWDRLIRDTDRLDGFRELFGDERADYGMALQAHYEQGPAADWQQRFVSAYASAHPWEDWAETWAHYLHMSDALQTAIVSGLSLRPRHKGEPAISTNVLKESDAGSFDRMIEAWIPLTYMINNLNRGLGLPDGYPFILSNPSIAKLRFVHETIAV